MSSSEEQKLPLSSLTAMVIGSMVGAGIFILPGRFATATGPFGALIAWVIAGTRASSAPRPTNSAAHGPSPSGDRSGCDRQHAV
jgi:hypothetical protein